MAAGATGQVMLGRPYSPADGKSMSRGSSKDKDKEDDDTGNVHVVLRIRPSFASSEINIPLRFQRVVLHPLSSQEVSIQLHSDPLPSSGSTQVVTAQAQPGGPNAKKGQTFVYDRVLGEDAGQEVVYGASAKEAVERFVKGMNVTIFAYGQTSSGKSYTMGTTGDDKDYLPPSRLPSTTSSATEHEAEHDDDQHEEELVGGHEDTSRVGIIPRAVAEIFEKVEEAKRKGGREAGWECKLSFLELYNEDLIDLLSIFPAAQSPAITIREDAKGRILWSGLREIKVTSVSDVMQYLRQGSSRRVKGETGMNKESSRSHAILSLSLVQRRRTGGGVAMGSVTPGTPGRRPMSLSGIPTPGGARSPTPTGGRPGSRTSMIPPSSMRPPATPGRVSPFSPTMQNDDENPFLGGGGAFVEIASKFHFVDLAGSERIKKTAATGDRMKEGIAINSGLTALGNVISALGDPKNASAGKGGVGVHVPYRDSKLTRLLQDSLGGNSYTVMIANVSPLEFNLSETLNTLKYAGRARNIKNKAEVNETELGWDDVEHLQSTVKKLRAELGGLKTALAEKGGATGDEDNGDRDGEQLRLAKVKLAELQAEHDDLESIFKETSLKLTRAGAELEESRQQRAANGGRPASTTKFAELVDPIIREYEQTISSLEVEVQRVKAAWQYASEIANEQETKLLASDKLREQQNDYVGELRVRIQRLTDRDATSEAHIADLEATIKVYSEREDANAVTVLELRKELAKHKELESNTAHYIAQLEAGSTKSEEQIDTLTAKVEKLESEVARKEELYEKLEARVKLLDTTEDNKILMQELDEKDHQIAATERKLEDALADCSAMAKERDRLREVTESQATAASSFMRRSTSAVTMEDSLVTPSTTEKTLTGSNSQSGSVSNGEKHGEDGSELVELKATHAETLVELDIVTVQYRDSLREIAELTTQLDELKLVTSETKDSLPESPGGTPLEPVAESVDPTGSPTTPGPSPRNGASRRRGSGRLSLNTGVTAVSVVNGVGFHSGRGGSNQSHSRQLSLSQELSSSESSLSGWADSNSLLSPNAAHRQSLPLLRPQRSVQSLETEIKQLQNVLKLRDEEIHQLEQRLRSNRGIPSRKSIADIKNTQTSSGSDDEPPSVSSHGDNYGNSTSPSTPESEHQALTPVTPARRASSFNENALSPQMKKQIDELRLSMNGTVEADSARVDELMRSMARKETAHREEIEALKTELAGYRAEMEVLTPDSDTPVGLGLSPMMFPGQPAKRSIVEEKQSHDELPRETQERHEANLQKLKHQHAQEIMKLSLDFDAVLKSSMEMKAAMRDKDTAASKAKDSAQAFELSLSALRQELEQLVLVCEPECDLSKASTTSILRSTLEQSRSNKKLLVQQTAQLKARTVELQDTKQTLEAVSADKTAKEATIQSLEHRIQDLSNAKTSEEDGARTRLSLARAATPSGGPKYPPPITPPPSIPPPPVPSALPAVPAIADVHKPSERDRGSVSTTASGGGSSSGHPVPSEGNLSETRLIAQVEEQENIIRTLNKQLLHCETDLQASMDLVSTLEQNLNTSERNLRRARTQMQENVKERDATSSEIARLRSELDAAKEEVSTVRNSVISEKRSLEDRLSEERKAKEKARAQLEQRLAEATAQKANSKFRCF